MCVCVVCKLKVLSHPKEPFLGFLCHTLYTTDMLCVVCVVCVYTPNCGAC